MGVAMGPFNPRRVRPSDSNTVSGRTCPVSESALVPAFTRSQITSIPVASTARTVASATSGPMPSPGIRVMRWAILAILAWEVIVIPDWRAERIAMVENQLRRRGIRSERVLEAIAKIPREEFVPAEHRVLSYSDEPI